MKEISNSYSIAFSAKINDNVMFGGEGDEDGITFDDYEEGGDEEADIDGVSVNDVPSRIGSLTTYYPAS